MHMLPVDIYRTGCYDDLIRKQEFRTLGKSSKKDSRMQRVCRATSTNHSFSESIKKQGVVSKSKSRSGRTLRQVFLYKKRNRRQSTEQLEIHLRRKRCVCIPNGQSWSAKAPLHRLIGRRKIWSQKKHNRRSRYNGRRWGTYAEKK